VALLWVDQKATTMGCSGVAEEADVCGCPHPDAESALSTIAVELPAVVGDGDRYDDVRALGPEVVG